MTSPVGRILERLERVKRSGSGWTARCPGHEDRQNSLAVSEGDDGRVLLKCFAGCGAEQVVAAVGLELRDLFPEGGGGVLRPSHRRAQVQRSPGTGCTLEQYAEAKRLPVDFLGGLGLADMTYLGSPAVRIPYLDETGGVTISRFRVALEGGDKFRWKSGTKAKGNLYGLSRLDQAREAGYVIVVEGESDAQSLWFHGYPAVAVPGADMWDEERNAGAVDGLDAIYVVIEPDRGGETVLGWVRASSIRDRVRLVRLEGVKDVSELHLISVRASSSRPSEPSSEAASEDGGGQSVPFSERLEAALQSATPWAQHERVEADLRRRAAWKACATLAHEPHILDRLTADARRLGIVGEERLVRVVYLALTSRLLDKIVSLALKGPSSAGKSLLVGMALRFLPDDAYYADTGASERALVFGEEDLRHRFIVLYEAEGLTEGFQTYLVRSLLSEGRISYRITEKGSDGRHVARHVVRDGPTGLIVTTTGIMLHPENETRLISLTVDDSPAQTHEILLELGEQATDDGATAVDLDLEPWHALQRWLEGGANSVVVPFARELAERVPPAAVRLRRDFAAVLSLVKAHALLHQASRDVDAKGRIVATPDDYAIVRDLISDVVAEGVGATVSEATRETVAAVEALTPEKSDGVPITAIAERLGLDRSSASRRWRAARPYLRNLEPVKGKAARIVVGEPLPGELELLPAVERLGDLCTCARISEGQGPPLPGDPGYPGWIDQKFHDGHIVEAEWMQARKLHASRLDKAA